MNKSPRYFGYVRVSTTKQGELGVSLDEQKSAIEEYAAKNSCHISQWFEDRETAAKRGRRMFNQMLKDLRAGRAEGVIIHKVDRGARNLFDWAYLTELSQNGVDVRLVADNIDLKSRGGLLMGNFQALLATDFSINLSSEVKKGMYGRVKQGLYPWTAPLGYLDNGKGKPKTIDPVKGPLVKYMFERYATNTVGFEALRHEMHALGLSTKGGKPLAYDAFTRAFRNPFYCGILRLKTLDEAFPGIHEPLISKALFERVQSIVRGKTVPKARKHLFLFRQMVHCESCGTRTLTGENHRTSFTYYRCHGRTCHGTSWTEAALEEVVRDHLDQIRLPLQGDRESGSNPRPWKVPENGGRGDVGTRSHPWGAGGIECLRGLVEKASREEGADKGRLKHSLKLRLDKIEDQMRRLMDLLLDRTIDRAAYTARKDELLMERQGLLDQMSSADGRSPLEQLFEEFENTNSQLLRYDTLDNDEKRELVEIVCSKFSVSRKSPTFTLRTPYKEIAETCDPQYGAHCRSDVRIERIFDTLKKIADRAGETGERPWTTSRPHVPTSPKPRGEHRRFG